MSKMPQGLRGSPAEPPTAGSRKTPNFLRIRAVPGRGSYEDISALRQEILAERQEVGTSNP